MNIQNQILELENDFVVFAQNFQAKIEALKKMARSAIIAVIKTIHPDYKPIRAGILIEAKERNRQEILGNTEEYVLDDDFKNKILAECKNGKTEMETLREDELLKRKTDQEIKKEMKISNEISPDQIAERIIQLGKIDCWKIIGYCKGLVVHAFPLDDGRVGVRARGLDDWLAGVRLLSRDIEAK